MVTSKDVGSTVTEQTTYNFGWIGGNLSLDFVNTVSHWRAGEWEEHLAGYADLLAWGEEAARQHGDGLTAAQAAALQQQAMADPPAAARVYKQATELRELLHRIFFATTQDQSPTATDLAAFNQMLGAALAQRQLVAGADDFTWGWRDEPVLERVVWPLLLSAADLLVSGDLGLVHECEDEDGCGWLFVDRTRTRRRRWCSMADCGNKAKVKSFRQRRKAGLPDEPSHPAEPK